MPLDLAIISDTDNRNDLAGVLSTDSFKRVRMTARRSDGARLVNVTAT